jgi:hypothetical protein
MMKNLVIEATIASLEVNLNADKGIFFISGNSYPENSTEFFKPIMAWLNEYFSANAQSLTIINMEVVYFNSSSSRQLYEFFNLLHKNVLENKVQINWIYDEENDAAEEAGEDFIDDFEDLNIQMLIK